MFRRRVYHLQENIRPIFARVEMTRYPLGTRFGSAKVYMPQAIQREIVKLIVTSRGLEPARYLRSALRAAIPGARVRSTGFRGIFAVEAEGDSSELATLVCDECSEKIGHVTAVLAIVESRKEAIKDAASRCGAAQIGPEESFCFRLHKRGAHGLEQDTSKLEREIGTAIWTALEESTVKNPELV